MASAKSKVPQRPHGRLHPLQILSGIAHFWLGRSRFTQAIVIGLVIEAVMHWGPPIVLRQQLEDATMDWAIRICGTSDVLSSAQKKSALTFSFLNIDEATYQEKWGSPFLTPRDKLLTLIEFPARLRLRISTTSRRHRITTHGLVDRTNSRRIRCQPFSSLSHGVSVMLKNSPGGRRWILCAGRDDAGGRSGVECHSPGAFRA